MLDLLQKIVLQLLALNIINSGLMQMENVVVIRGTLAQKTIINWQELQLMDKIYFVVLQMDQFKFGKEKP